mgnify:CR=1 FL=1
MYPVLYSRELTLLAQTYCSCNKTLFYKMTILAMCLVFQIYAKQYITLSHMKSLTSWGHLGRESRTVLILISIISMTLLVCFQSIQRIPIALLCCFGISVFWLFFASNCRDSRAQRHRNAKVRNAVERISPFTWYCTRRIQPNRYRSEMQSLY